MAPGAAVDRGFERRTPDWVSPEEARERILKVAALLAVERVPLLDALGRALAEDVTATAMLPPWDNSGMDGFAVRGEDIEGASEESPVTLRVTGLVRAGAAATDPLPRGSAFRIMTGAPVPPGADSVVRVEDTDGERTPGTVEVRSDRDRLGNIRPGGQDMRPGEIVASAGRAVDPGVIAAAAATGATFLPVRRRPTVAIVTTGDELRRSDRFDDVLAGRGVPETNGTMLAAAVVQSGGVPILSDVVPDDPDALGSVLDAYIEADALVTVGGASMGEADLVKRVLARRGLHLDFWRVTMRPGSPFGFGWVPRSEGRLPVFSLPGNPASSFVTFELFVRPWLLRVAGHAAVDRPRIECIAGEELRGSPGWSFFMRVALDSGSEGLIARQAGPQGSGLVRWLAHADGLAVIPPEPGVVTAGDPVEVVLLSAAIARRVEPTP